MEQVTTTDLLPEAWPYDPTIGRFITKDPIGFAGGSANLYTYCGGVEKGIETNLYAYSFNDPINYIDPDGKFGVLIVRAAIVGGAALLTYIYETDPFARLRTDIFIQDVKDFFGPPKPPRDDRPARPYDQRQRLACE
ncbi:MAG: hypothetical protein COT73_08040 [Bdellovibrio sp. CG10_big_fil_rev_8_21_14_0_10_47_8]|nr:MAG: hypothetical protein COT73_08040 [Bdellovibrio sp. CG10_big_fil_rev_8_21_14_0_10_47_8]